MRAPRNRQKTKKMRQNRNRWEIEDNPQRKNFRAWNGSFTGFLKKDCPESYRHTTARGTQLYARDQNVLSIACKKQDTTVYCCATMVTLPIKTRKTGGYILFDYLWKNGSRPKASGRPVAALLRRCLKRGMPPTSRVFLWLDSGLSSERRKSLQKLYERMGFVFFRNQGVATIAVMLRCINALEWS